MNYSSNKNMRNVKFINMRIFFIIFNRLIQIYIKYIYEKNSVWAHDIWQKLNMYNFTKYLKFVGYSSNKSRIIIKKL